MNNASPGHRLFEAHADQRLLVGKQQRTTLRLGHVSCWLSWRSCSISWHPFSHGKTRASSVLLMAYRKSCILLFTLQQDCNTRAKRVGSISWYPFSPWQNSSELGFAHGLPKALFIVVKVVQVVFHYKQECAPKAKRPCCFPSSAGRYGFSWRLARRSATT